MLIDVSDRLAITDIFVIMTGSNERQVEAIVDEVEEQLRLAGFKPLRREGRRDGRWVLLDYSEIVVHVQHSEERVFYSLERLWKDCPVIDFDPDGPAQPGAQPSAVGGSDGATQAADEPAGTAPTDDESASDPAESAEA